MTPQRAIAIQMHLAPQVGMVAPQRPIRFVAGADAGFSDDDRDCIAGVVLWDLHHALVLEQHLAIRRLTFPYIPGLLSFREAPAVIDALRRLRRRPDVLLYDGHGLAHPRRFGSACHIGIIADLPTIGCAKTRLVGTDAEPDRHRGAAVPLVDAGTVIGVILRTQDGVRPVYVSIGHQMDLPTAERVVLECAPRYRVPEPIRFADQLVGAAKRRGDTGRDVP